MEIGRALPYLALLSVSLPLTYFTRREFVSISAAILAAYYASIGDVDMSAASALTIVSYSLARVSLARPTRGARVVLMKLRYVLVPTAILVSSVPIAYVALGSALSLSPLESQGPATIITALLYVLVGAAVVPRLSSISSPNMWQALRLENVEELLWRAGIVVGGVTMLVNVAVHGVFALIIMLAYIATILATRRLRPPIPGISAATVAGMGAVLVYIVGYV